MSKYYTPPSPLSPNTTAHSGTFNTDFAGVDAAFTLVANDMAKTLSHATLTLNPLNQTAGQMAGKYIGLDSTGLSLVAAASIGTWKGTWVTGTAYNQGDTFQDPNAPFSVYYATKNYTSGATLATDVGTGNAVAAVSLSNLPYMLAVTNKTASFVAAVGNIYVIPSAVATVNITLPAGALAPAGPSGIIVVSVNSGVNQIVNLVPNGTDPINGVNATVVLRGAGAGEMRGAQIYWSGNTGGWIVG